jgi:hypothetical protein
MRKLALTTSAVALLVCSPVRAAPPPPVLDQSFTSPNNATNVIGDCCEFVAETFTAGSDGRLAGVSIDTYKATPAEPDVPLRVSIRNTVSGLPGTTVLAETILPSVVAPLSQLITFPQIVQIQSGVKYAIVVNLERGSAATKGGWDGGTANPYPRGDACAGDGGTSWFCYTDLFDSHFKTYLAPSPTSKDQCKNGGWRDFGVFENQGDCVSFVATGGKNPPAG